MTLNSDFTFAAIILAAGRSRRFEAGNKMLYPWHKKPLLLWAVGNVLDAGIRTSLIVTGQDRKPIETLLTGQPVMPVYNENYRQGMGTSIATAIRALPPEVDAAYICLGDMPHISPQIFASLSQAFAPARGHEIIAPQYKGRQGHPVLFGRRFFPKLATLKEDQGAKSILQAHQHNVAHICVETEDILFDIDRLNEK